MKLWLLTQEYIHSKNMIKYGTALVAAETELEARHCRRERHKLGGKYLYFKKWAECPSLVTVKYLASDYSGPAGIIGDWYF